MREGPIPLERLIACIKNRMQQARQTCPFFQLEQQAVESPAPFGLEPARLLQQLILPEICAEGLAGPLPWTLEQQMQLCEALPAWIVNTESSFFGSSPELLKKLRQQDPQRYLIAQDLIIDEYQILQARIAGANALILSLALLGIRRTQLYIGKIRFWEMEPLLAIHSLEDVRMVRELKAQMVLLAPLPGNSRSWSPEDLQAASQELKGHCLLIHASPEQADVPTDVAAIAPGWQLWQQSDPAADLQALSQRMAELKS